MTLYVMDTDHISLVERGNLLIRQRIVEVVKRADDLSTTVVSMEEQLAGRLAQIRRATDSTALSSAYQRLKGTYALFADLELLDYDAIADNLFQSFRKDRIRIGTHDLRIASITLANKGIVLTRNRRDFEKVPGLTIQDWSIER